MRYNNYLTQAQLTQRQKAMAAAIGSVRAEGLLPSMKTQKRMRDYADGKITLTELRRGTLQEIKHGK